MNHEARSLTRACEAASHLKCAGCGLGISAADPAPFRCPNAGRDDADHVVTRVLDPSSVRLVAESHPHPFVRYRELLHAYHVSRVHGFTDGDWNARVEGLDRAIADVDGHGFAVTPFARGAALSRELGFSDEGGVWVKDETRNVAGSHKARHLMGIALFLEAAEAARSIATPCHPPRRAPLAIASCGNAALAAAVVARAAGRALDVYVPPDAEHAVLVRLTTLGARVVPCPRTHGAVGDPCMERFREAVAAGAVPFSVQGSENGLAIDGGATLGYEIVEALRAERWMLDHVFVQVGGGALASAIFQAFDDARALGVLAATPRIHAVQSEGAYPLRRAYERVRALVFEMLGEPTPHGVALPGPAAAGGSPLAARPDVMLARSDHRAADLMRSPAARDAVGQVLAHAAAHRSEFMWPWEHPPVSIAHGILDDETYDWHAVVRGMIASGGWPLVVSEDTLHAAHGLAHTATGVHASATGSAGLAGLVDLVRCGVVGPEARAAVLLTGIER